MNETELAQQLGVSRQSLGDMRRTDTLREGEHWERQGRVVEYTAAGIRAVKSTMEIEPQQEIAPPHPEPVQMLTVSECSRNPRLLWAVPTEKEAPSTAVRVRVRENRNFIPGMRIRARHLNDDLYVLEGRTPRFRGKW